MTSAVVAVPLPKPAPSLWNKFAVPGDGVQKILAVVSKILTSIAAFFAEAPTLVCRFADVFKSSTVVLGLFDIIGAVKYWVSDHSLSTIWQKTVAKVAWTATVALDAMLFFRHLKVFDIIKVAGKIGNFPVFSSIFSVVCLVSSTFSTWTDVLGVRKAIDKVRSIEKEITKINEDKSRPDSDKKIKVTVLSQKLQEAKTERTKEWISLAGSIAKLIFAIIVLVGLIAGIASLAFTGGPMLAVGGVLAAYGLFKFIYEQLHPKPTEIVLKPTT